jgi:hypothetical protein
LLFICIDVICRYHSSRTAYMLKVSEIKYCKFGTKRRTFAYC